MTRYMAVGKSTRRLDAPEKLTGSIRYAGDLPFVGLLHARLVLSPYTHARIVNIDTSGAMNVTGVVAAFTGETLSIATRNSASRSYTPLAQKEVLWYGQPVAIVLGETEAAAEDGAVAIDVDYEPLPFIIDPIAAFQFSISSARSTDNGGCSQSLRSKEAMTSKSGEFSSGVGEKEHFHFGDIKEGFRESYVIVEHTYNTSSIHQSYIEPQVVTAMPSLSGSGLTVWSSSQDMFGIRADISAVLNIPERQIRIEPVPIGGSFGGKYGLVEPLAAAVAYALHKPVRLVYTRSEDLLAGNPAPRSAITLKLGAKQDGTLVALQAQVVFDAGAYPDPDVSTVLGGYFLVGTYCCPNIDIRCFEVQTNKVSIGAYRAPSGPQATFALESAVDELCRMLKIDPIEFRRKNSLKEDDTAIDRHLLRWPRTGLLECLGRIQEHSLWTHHTAIEGVPEELKDWRIGLGIAIGGLPGSTRSTRAACRLELDGTITVIIGTSDITGVGTSLAQIVAEELEISISAISVIYDNTDTMPYTHGTGGSKAIYSIGPAVLAAAKDARNQILAIASDILEVDVKDLEFKNSNATIKGMPNKKVELAKIAHASVHLGRRYPPVYGYGCASNKISSPMFTAHIARVAVDPETGEVRVIDYVAAQDVGFAINPAEVGGQICGGVVQGIGQALFEELVYDEQGQLLTSTFMDYALPRSVHIPAITPILVEVPSALGPFGAKGAGEPPIIPVSAAIANAIYDAVGVRMTQLPITPERLWRAMHPTE